MATVEGSASLLDDIMPSYDVREVHDLRVPAARDVAYAATMELTAGEVRLFRPLMLLRMLPTRLRGEIARFDQNTRLLDLFLRNGFIVLAERPGDEVVIGVIGRFWSVTRNDPPSTVLTPQDFESFAEPDYAKAAISLRMQTEGSYTRIVTETRVVSTSPDASRKFGRYWFVIRWGSGAIRRSWLHAIRRRVIKRQGRAPAAESAA